jgi:hypothetical protein
MKKPTWVTLVGVLGIIFGSTAAMGAGQTLLMPFILDLYHEMFPAMLEYANSTSDMPPMSAEVSEMLDTYFGDNPAWFTSWSIFAGIAGLIICGAYIFASISLLLLRPNAVRLFYWAAGASIGLAVAKPIVALLAGAYLALFMLAQTPFGVVIDVVLVLTVFLSDKTAFSGDGTATVES